MNELLKFTIPGDPLNAQKKKETHFLFKVVKKGYKNLLMDLYKKHYNAIAALVLLQVVLMIVALMPTSMKEIKNNILQVLPQ